MSSKTTSDPNPLIIERQMRLRYARDKARREKPEGAQAPRYRFITISRDNGTGGDAIAQLLASRLNWHVYDTEIVNHIAENSHVRESLVSELDERSEGLIQDALGRFLRMAEGGSFGVEDYHTSLLQTLHLLAVRGDAVLVGRGGNFALAGVDGGFHVRIVGSQHERIGRLSARWHLDNDTTRRRVTELDSARRSFIKHHFKQDLDAPLFYDMIFNTDRLQPAQVVSSIVSALDL